MNEIALWDCISPTYLRTRVIPLATGRALMLGGINGLRSRNERGTLRITEIGCGAGRLMACLALSSGRFRYLGLDFSRKMLMQVPVSVRQDARFRIQEQDCAKRHALIRSDADLVLVHWVTNATSKWQEILSNAALNLRPGGRLLWFDEWSDLYSLVDGMSVSDEFASEMAQSFKNGLGNWGDRELEKRPGLKMRNNDMHIFLSGHGFRIERRINLRRQWLLQRNYRWLARWVWGARSFSNFRRIPEHRFSRGMHSILAFLDRFPVHSRRFATLQTESYPVVASVI